MTPVDLGLLLAGLACWALAICMLSARVNVLTRQAARQSERIDELERTARDALVLARKRLVAGRSGR